MHIEQRSRRSQHPREESAKCAAAPGTWISVSAGERGVLARDELLRLQSFLECLILRPGGDVLLDLSQVELVHTQFLRILERLSEELAKNGRNLFVFEGGRASECPRRVKST